MLSFQPEMTLLITTLVAGVPVTQEMGWATQSSILKEARLAWFCDDSPSLPGRWAEEHTPHTEGLREAR